MVSHLLRFLSRQSHRQLMARLSFDLGPVSPVLKRTLAGRVKVKFVDANTVTADALFADIVIVADGCNSNIRNTLLPDVQREYSGYMCWRGTVREGDIDEKWNALYSEKATFHLMNRTYLLK